MKKISILLVIILILENLIFPYNIHPQEKEGNNTKKLILSRNYYVKFGIIPVGTVNVTLFEEGDRYTVNATVRTIGIADVVYPVRDDFISTFKKDLSSFIRAKYTIREGSYKRDDEFELNGEELICSRNGNTIRRNLQSERVFDMVSSHFAFILGMRAGKDYRESADFLVIDCKKDIKPEVDYYGESVIKRGETEIKVYQYSLLLPVKGILLAREEDKRVYLLLDQSEKWLIYAYVPTKWGNIHVEAE